MQNINLKYFFIVGLFLNFSIFSNDSYTYQKVCMDDAYFNNLPDDYYFKKKSQISEKKESISNIKTVVFIAPVWVTGGMENLCQFAHELKQQGLDVYMICIPFRDGAGFRTVPNNIICKKNINGSWYLCGLNEDHIPPVYKLQYDLSYLNHDVILDSSTLIVTHEGWIDYLPFFENAKKMICWLSVGNVHCFDRSRTCKDLINKKCLYLMDCFHTSQAPWVHKTLQSWGVSAWILNDYISLWYILANKETKCTNTIAYYPTKGGDLARLFISKYLQYEYIKIAGLDNMGMIHALDQAMIYIDFGNFPGKDRIPREALLRDCIIFIHNAGCATDYESFPIDDYFRFSDDDVINGTLQKKIDDAVCNYNKFYNKQSTMRNLLYQEHEEFKENVKKIVYQLNSEVILK